MEFSLEVAQKYPPACLSYSQEGEDLILQRFFETKENGFYIDVGAHNPTRFSNTFIFYLKGWRGINIEPTPGSKTAFDSVRPKDLNIECAVGFPGSMNFFLFNDGALNTFDANNAKNICTLCPQYYIIDTLLINKIPLSAILEEHLKADKQIDFLNIDAEGGDLEAAQSNDWAKFRPTLVLVENHARKGKAGQALIRNFMAEQRYKLVFRTVNTDIFECL